MLSLISGDRGLSKHSICFLKRMSLTNKIDIQAPNGLSTYQQFPVGWKITLPCCFLMLFFNIFVIIVLTFAISWLVPRNLADSLESPEPPACPWWRVKLLHQERTLSCRSCSYCLPLEEAWAALLISPFLSDCNCELCSIGDEPISPASALSNDGAL